MKVYLYVIDDVYVYLANGKIATTMDVSDSDLFEDGIRLGGGTLVEIENSKELTGDFYIRDSDDVVEKAFQDRLLNYIEKNGL